MASIIRIKRSSVSGNPTTLAAGELAYSAYSGAGGNRLYIGMGTETTGNAANHLVIGGTYYTGLIDASTAGALTTNASSIPVLSSTGTIDKWYVGNLYSSANTIQATNTNGGITLTPNGSGYVTISGTNGIVIPSGTSAQQGPAVTGAVRFNTTTSQYEGYNGANWTSLGGVRSVDGLTYIIAESSPGASDDILHFYAATGASTSTQVATLDATKLAILNTTASSSTTTGALTVAGGVGIAGNLYVGGNLVLSGSETSIGGVTFQNGLTLSGSDSVATEYFKIQNGSGTDKFVVDSANGNTTISGTLGVTGATTLSSTLGVTGAATLSSTLGLAGDFAINTNKFNVTAASGNTSIAGTLSLTGAATLNSTANVIGDFSVNSNKFNVTASSGNTTIAGTLGVTGATTLSSTLGVTGATTLSSTLGVTGAATLSSTLAVTGVTTHTGAVYVNGGITANSGVTITAGGSNTNINLVPQGTGTVDVASKRITNLAEPTQATDAATKNYVDAVKTGLDVKDSARLATTANLSATYNNGTSGVGATLTNSGTQAALTLDSVPVVIGDRILVKDQSTAAQNGIYVVTTVGTASTNWVLTRAGDADNSNSLGTSSNELTGGTFVFIEEGTNNGDNGFVCTTNGTVTLGTTAIDWVQFSGAGQVIAGGGLTKTGNQIDVVGTANRITVNADSIDIASTYVGQTSITTLGTIGTGVWQGTIVNPTYGGTGVNNGSYTITLGGNVSTAGSFTLAGAYATTLTVTGATSLTLPTSGTLATLSNSETLSNKTITSSSFSGTTITASGLVSLTNTTDATATNAAALVLAGGLGIAKSVYVGVNITGSGASTSNIDGFNIDGGTY